MRISSIIKDELKKLWPSVKFSVTTDSKSWYRGVQVSWTNGPSKEKVDEITKKYQKGHFDGMIDSYEYTNTNKDIPQVYYINLSNRRG